MKTKKIQSGISLTEAVLAVAVIALLVGVSIPAYKAFDTAINSPAGVQSMLSAALSSARAIAAKNQKYAGIRFQQDTNGNQYMIPIIHDNEVGPGWQGNLAMKAMEGKNPVKLPANVRIVDLKAGSYGSENDINSDGTATDSNLEDSKTFVIIFSPSGGLVIHEYWARKQDNNDTIFNSTGDYMFEEDTERELSRSYFLIYDKEKLKETDESFGANNRWTKYLQDLDVLYINPYTGTIINN